MPLSTKLKGFMQRDVEVGRDEEERKTLTREHADAPQYDPHDAAEAYLLNQSLKRTNTCLKMTIGLLCIFILALLTVRSPNSFEKINGSDDSLITSPVPPIATTSVVFAEEEIYARRPDPESDAAWDALLPPGRGFVYIPDREDYGLPPGEETPYGMIYSVALFHQLHCLGQLRRFTWMFLDAIVANGTRGEMDREAIVKMFHVGDHAEHLHHCFDYLRQTIQCGGDMAMEWARTEADGRRFAVDGWGIPHECRDWDTIMDYMDKNHFNMSTNTQIAPLGGTSGKL